MVSRLRLCRATQSARASASATVPIASTSTASYSPKIKVDVIGSKPNASPKGFGRSPTIVFPGAVKTFTLSVFDSGVFDATGTVTRVLSFGPFVPPILYSFRCHFFGLSFPFRFEGSRWWPGAAGASMLCVHPFDPLSAKCGRHEWIRKVLRFPRNLVARELHDADGIRRLGVICYDQFGDPKITAANDSSDSKPLFARLTSALVLYVASTAG